MTYLRPHFLNELHVNYRSPVQFTGLGKQEMFWVVHNPMITRIVVSMLGIIIL